MKEISVYCSGASGGITDLIALIQLGMLIGVEINRLSEDVRSLVVDYARAGSRVFVDSGAYWAFKKGLKLNFEKVLRVYNELIGDTKGNLALVAPDVIGDQRKTFELLTRHRDQLLKFMENGAEVLVPLHVGQLRPYDAYKKAIEILGSRIVVAIPSAKKAFSNDELRELLCRGKKPNRLHFLGITPASKRWSLKERIVSVLAPNASISMDGCFLRSIVGNQQAVDKIGEHSNDLAEDGLNDFGDLSEFDETEYIPFLLEEIIENRCLPFLDKHFPFLNELIEDLDNDQIEIDELEIDDYMYAELRELAKLFAIKKARPIARSKYIVRNTEDWLRKKISSINHNTPVQYALPM